MNIALVANTSWYLHNFRTTLMDALRAAGHDVITVAPTDAHSARLTQAGFAHHPIPLDAKSINPFREMRSVSALRRAFRDHKIDLVFSFTPKGNIYSGLALEGAMAFVPNVSGLGHGFAQGSPLQAVMRPLYRRTFRKADAVLFQNAADMRLLVDGAMVDARKAQLVPGSGVDLRKFTPRAKPDNGTTVFLLVARLLWAKGLGEFAQAAARIRCRYPAARFQILGPLAGGGQGVPQAALDGWARDGTIEYLGQTDDVRPYIAAADCIVLPSFYREGVPRSLLEAAAMARPVITTDMAGCRDAIEDGVTGLLCRPRDAGDLTAALEKFLALPSQARAAMGAAGRTRMERQFDEKLVLDTYLELAARHARR